MQYNRKAALKEDHTPHYGNRTHYGMTAALSILHFVSQALLPARFSTEAQA
jgi:hypothetical protein